MEDLMAEELVPKRNESDGSGAVDGQPRGASPLGNGTNPNTMGSHLLSGSAIAIALASVALPLVKVGKVEAQSVAYCASDNYSGQDIGDPGDCADCTYSMLPTDCLVVDPGGATHWGTSTVDTYTDVVTDSGGGGGGGSDYPQEDPHGHVDYGYE
jgi:hypothetical protein